MPDLSYRIARLELIREQLDLHLQELPIDGPDAREARSKLAQTLQELAALKKQNLPAQIKTEAA